MRYFWLLLLFGICTIGQPLLHTATPDASFAIRDIDGSVRHPFALSGHKAVVFLFISDECPISNGYAPEINRIQASYAAKKIQFYLVSVDTGVPVTQIKQHAQLYAFQCPDLLDPSHRLVKQFGASVTPEAFVYASNRRLLYKGRIDDKYADFGKTRFSARTHDLRDALDAIVAGEPVPHPTTKAVGCYI